MNMTGAVIPAVVGRARRRVVAHFADAHAITPGDAVPYRPERLIDGRQFEHLLERGVLHESRPGEYWLELPALKADEDARRRRLVPVVIAVFVVLAVALTFLYRG